MLKHIKAHTLLTQHAKEEQGSLITNAICLNASGGQAVEMLHVNEV